MANFKIRVLRKISYERNKNKINKYIKIQNITISTGISSLARIQGTIVFIYIYPHQQFL